MKDFIIIIICLILHHLSFIIERIMWDKDYEKTMDITIEQLIRGY